MSSAPLIFPDGEDCPTFVPTTGADTLGVSVRGPCSVPMGRAESAACVTCSVLLVFASLRDRVIAMAIARIRQDMPNRQRVRMGTRKGVAANKGVVTNEAQSCWEGILVREGTCS